MATPRDQPFALQLPGRPAHRFASLGAAESAGAGPLHGLPYSLRALADCVLRTAPPDEALAQLSRLATRKGTVGFRPRRLLMQDSAGLPVLADLAAVEEALGDSDASSGLRPLKTNLVVDHSVEVDRWGGQAALAQNLDLEYERNASRYAFLRWMENSRPWLKVTPPGQGICHQLNLEQFAEVAGPDENGLVGVDSVMGTDSHTPMVNALGVLGWGVGGIEALSIILGEPVELEVPEVVGVRLTGAPAPGVLATDVALSLTAALRRSSVVGAFVEFFGAGVDSLRLPDRATISNMAPEYGSTIAYFPPDAETLRYLRDTGRPEAQVALCQDFLAAQGLYRGPSAAVPNFDRLLEFDLGSVRRTVAGPRRPEQRLDLREVPATAPEGQPDRLDNGSVAIAAITSCTNTANPRALVAAGLLARAAASRGLKPRPWVKTSFAPGSRSAAALVAAAGLQEPLDDLGFQVVGFGCTTCMGNSGPLDPSVRQEIEARGLSVAAVISGNRNFEGRINRWCELTYLGSPAMVVAYALAGTVKIDLEAEPLGRDRNGEDVLLSSLWPSDTEIDAVLERVGSAPRELPVAADAVERWQATPAPDGPSYPWEDQAGFIRRPPFLAPDLLRSTVSADIRDARALLVLGDAVTTDHISPVAAISEQSEAGRWLVERGVKASHLGSFSTRRINHEVMVRGGFANPRLKNALADRDGGWTTILPEGRLAPVHEAAATYRTRGVPMIVVGGERYGTGSARDWAAKVTRLLGVSAVLAESFERIHRRNLLALGVAPVKLPRDVRESLTGRETFDIEGLSEAVREGTPARLRIRRENGEVRELDVQVDAAPGLEREWLVSGGVLARFMNGLSRETGSA